VDRCGCGGIPPVSEALKALPFRIFVAAVAPLLLLLFLREVAKFLHFLAGLVFGDRL